MARPRRVAIAAWAISILLLPAGVGMAVSFGETRRSRGCVLTSTGGSAGIAVVAAAPAAVVAEWGACAVLGAYVALVAILTWRIRATMPGATTPR